MEEQPARFDWIAAGDHSSVGSFVDLLLITGISGSDPVLNFLEKRIFFKKIDYFDRAL